MGYIEQTKIVAEYLNFLRNSDILTKTVRNVTTKTNTFDTSVNGTETFTLSELGCKNIRSVTYDDAPMYLHKDYSIDLDKSQVIIPNIKKNKEVTITYDYGNDKIFPDYPRPDLTINSYPRIGFGIYGFRTEVAGFGNVLRSSWRFDVRAYATSSEQADTLIDSLRKINIDAFNKLECVNRIYPLDVRDLDYFETTKGKNKIYVKGIDIMSINSYEIN